MSAIDRVARIVRQPPPFPPFRQGSFRSRVHDDAPAAWLGVALGVSFGICALTGMISHLVQAGGSFLEHDVVSGGGWALWPTAPVGLYRLTQGLHVVTGFAAIPLLLAKLFVVYPLLWAWPPVRGLRHLIERASLAALVGGSLFLLVTGVQNVMYWYPWRFFFPIGHYWAAWVTIGALVMHIGAKSSIVARVWRERRPGAGDDDRSRDDHDAEDDGGAGDDPGSDDGTLPADRGLTRRGVLVAAGATSGLLVVTVVGGTVRPLEALAYLSVRSPSTGPQGFPVNKTAESAQVMGAANDPNWRLRVVGAVDTELTLSLDDLAAMRQREHVLPIACVEGWSASKRWRGVAVADLLGAAGAPPGRPVRIESLQSGGFYRASDLKPELAADPVTLLATHVEDERLHIDHGFPLRLIAPNNPGVLQTKWVATMRVL